MSSTSSQIQTGVSSSIKLQYVDANGNVQNIPFPLPVQRYYDTPSRQFPTQPPGRLFHENFLSPKFGMTNDGAAGSLVYRDTEIMFAGYPSIRLDTNGTSTAQSNPGTGPVDTAGIIFKERLSTNIPNLGGLSGVSGIYAWEGWVRFTSNNLATNTIPSISIYLRDGTNINVGTIWFDTTTLFAFNKMQLQYLNSGGTYTVLGSQNVGWGTVSYDLGMGVPDEEGVWNYWYLAIDFGNGVYKSFQFNDIDYTSTINNAPIRAAPDTASLGNLHFSLQFASKTSTRRYINYALLSGYRVG